VPFARIIGIDLLAPERLDLLEADLSGRILAGGAYISVKMRSANGAHVQRFIDRAHCFCWIEKGSVNHSPADKAALCCLKKIAYCNA
jgi:hypothetical protein